MNTYILTKTIHLLSVFSVVAFVVSELFLLAPQLSRKQIKTLARVDGGYGLSAIVAVATGIFLWLYVGKGEAYYSEAGLVYVKLILFSIVGLLSVYPTVWFIKNRKGAPDELVDTPILIKPLLLIELALLATMPYWAVVMVQGGF